MRGEETIGVYIFNHLDLQLKRKCMRLSPKKVLTLIYFTTLSNQ